MRRRHGDRPHGGYNAAKIVQEGILLAGPVPVRILRATQFHEFVGQMLEWGTRDEVGYVPHMRTQLVAARNVAEALADLATGPDPETTPMVEIAGPQVEDLPAVAALLATRRGQPLKVEGVTDPDDPDAPRMATDALLPGPDAIIAGPTFARWLDAQP